MTWKLTKNRPIHLILENSVTRDQLIKLLKKLPTEVKSFESVDEFLAEPLSEAPACLITGFKLSNTDGISLIKLIRQYGLYTPVVVVADRNGGVENAVQVIQAGAADFIESPIVERDFFERIQVILKQSGN